MSDEPQHSQKQSAWPLANVILVVTFAYLASYAPVVRIMGGYRRVPAVTGRGYPVTDKRPIDGDYLPVYKPIDWLIDETPLRDPLMWWADFCGVGKPFVAARMWRR